jgi:hypothetical protein
VDAERYRRELERILATWSPASREYETVGARRCWDPAVNIIIQEFAEREG